MKKSYRKPLVYCENHDTGVVISNSEEYEQEMKRKLEEFRQEEQQILIKKEYGEDESNE